MSAILHLRKLCVGAESIESLAAWQEARKAERGGKVWHVTRYRPRRVTELLDGGSLYWVIKGIMCVRQPIVGFEEHPPENPAQRPKCRIVLAPDLITTEPWPHRPFQGWRYLKAGDAPPDLKRVKEGEERLPSHLTAELRGMGVL